MNLSIIIVSYNSRDVLRACVRSLECEKPPFSVEVIIVDNGSVDGTQEMIRREFPRVRLIANDENLGFAAANNIGIAASQGTYVLLLNPDTVVHDNTLEEIVHFLDNHQSVWVAGCRLMSADGSLQQSAGAFPSILEGFMNSSFLYRLLPENMIIHRHGFRMFDDSAAAQVDWVMGAFFMVRRTAFDEIGVLDERFFMYTEEVDFCRRVHAAGYEVWYIPAGTVTHFWGGMSAVSKHSLLWLVASQLLYFKKHHRGAERVLLVVLKYAGLAVRILVYAVGGILTMRRDLLAKSSYVASALFRLLTTRPAGLWRSG